MNVSNAWLLAALAAVVAAAIAVVLFKRRSREELTRQILRLAAEIEEVAGTVEADLGQVPQRAFAGFASFAAACAECARRARKALAVGATLQDRPRVVLTSTLLLLHEDHRRIVDLRSDVDRALALWKKRSDAAPRVYRFDSGERATLPTSSVPRPSGFV